MTISALIVTAVLLGLTIWFVDAGLPIGRKAKRFISASVTLCVAIWILQAYSVLPPSSHIGHVVASSVSGQLARSK